MITLESVCSTVLQLPATTKAGTPKRLMGQLLQPRVHSPLIVLPSGSNVRGPWYSRTGLVFDPNYGVFALQIAVLADEISELLVIGLRMPEW